MFKGMIPWKKRHSNVLVRRDEVPRAEEYHPLARLRDEFDSLMNRFFEELPLGERFFGNLPNLWSDARWNWNLNAGWQETDKEYVLQAELPGFEPEELDVQVSGNVLSVRAEHKDEKKEPGGGSSRSYGSFSRSVTLPQGVDAANIQARYHSGVLEVCLPKTAEGAGASALKSSRHDGLRASFAARTMPRRHAMASSRHWAAGHRKAPPRGPLQRPHDRRAAPVVEQRVDGEHAAAHAALVDAGVGHAVREDVVGVDPTVAGHHRLGHAVARARSLVHTLLARP